MKLPKVSPKSPQKEAFDQQIWIINFGYKLPHPKQDRLIVYFIKEFKNQIQTQSDWNN